MNESAGDARITALMGQYAVQMRPWVRFVAVLTFITAGFMIVVGLGIVLIGTLAGAASREAGALGAGLIGGGLIGGVYLGMGAIYLAPAIFLNRTAKAARRMETGDQANGLEDLLKNQKSFWRFVGILMLVFLILTVLVLVLGLGAAILTGLNAVRS